MSTQKYHKIEVKQIENTEGPMTGANTEIFIDGEKLRGVTSIKFEGILSTR